MSAEYPDTQMWFYDYTAEEQQQWELWGVSCLSSSVVLGLHVCYLNPCWRSTASNSIGSVGPTWDKPCFHSLGVTWVQEERNTL